MAAAAAVMHLTEAQLAEYRASGFVVLDAPWPKELTRRLIGCVQAIAEPPESVEAFGLGKGGRVHHTLRPVQPDSYWSHLDHSLDFLQVILHPEVVELAVQLEGKQSSSEIFFRNAGINGLRHFAKGPSATSAFESSRSCCRVLGTSAISTEPSFRGFLVFCQQSCARGKPSTGITTTTTTRSSGRARPPASSSCTVSSRLQLHPLLHRGVCIQAPAW